jgi:nucleoid DNA-binding protein
MTKAHLIDIVAKNAHLTKKAAADAADALFNEMIRALGKGEKVVISGFGTFDRTTVEDKEVVPFGKTHLRTKIKAHGKVNFKPGRPLKQAVW